MPRFYFDVVEDGICMADSDGVVAEQLDEAEVEASFAVAEMMTDPRFTQLRDLEIVIRDEKRSPVSRVSLSLRRERREHMH
jgi:hypothetical protein